MRRKQQKAIEARLLAKTRNIEVPPNDEAEEVEPQSTKEGGQANVTPESEPVEVGDSSNDIPLEPRRKRPKGEEEPVVDKHVPEWIVLNSDSIIGMAHPSARILGGRILRGATLPQDQAIVVPRTQLMAALAVVSAFPCT